MLQGTGEENRGGQPRPQATGFQIHLVFFPTGFSFSLLLFLMVILYTLILGAPADSSAILGNALTVDLEHVSVIREVFRRPAVQRSPAEAAGAGRAERTPLSRPTPATGWGTLTEVLLVVQALRGHGLLWRAVRAAMRAAVPKAVRLLGWPVPGQGTRRHHEAPAVQPEGAQGAES